MSGLSEFIEYLENKYNQPVSFMRYLLNTYGEINRFDDVYSMYEDKENYLYDAKEETESELTQDISELENGQENEFEVADDDVAKVCLTFVCDKDVNLGVIKQLLTSIKDYEKQIFDRQKDKVASKLVKKYIKELEKMEDDKEIYESEKLADKYTKTLKKTLMKLWGNKQFREIIKQYFEDNVICLEKYEIGHRLKDDEFEFLDEQLTAAMSVKTYNPADHDKVIEMVQPIIKIYYEEEEGENDYKYVAGSCRFYQYIES